MDNINWEFELGRIFGTILLPFFCATLTVVFKRFRSRDYFIGVSFVVLLLQLFLQLFGLQQLMIHEIYSAALDMGVEPQEFIQIETRRTALGHFVSLLVIIFIGYLKPIGDWLKKEIF
jgi:hypothetical protein